MLHLMHFTAVAYSVAVSHLALLETPASKINVFGGWQQLNFERVLFRARCGRVVRVGLMTMSFNRVDVNFVLD